MNYIVTKNINFYKSIGNFNYCDLNEIILPSKIACDTETTSLSPLSGDIFSVQLGTGKDNYLLDLTNNGYNFEEIVYLLKDKELLFHNSCFDLGFFYKHNFFPEKVKDTMLASMILYNGMHGSVRHGFGYVMERELGLEYDKSEQKNITQIKLSTKRAIDYCFNDVDQLLNLESVLHTKLKFNGSEPTYLLHCRYIKALAYMEQCGLPIDSQRWIEKIETDKKSLNNIKMEITNYIYNNLPEFRDNQLSFFSTDNKIILDFQSPLQMFPVFEAFEIDIMDNSKPPKKSIKEDVIRKSKHEFVDKWLTYKGLQHSINNFGQNILDKVINGRIYTTFKPILDTARISTRKGGINFLNFPANKETRRAFKAKEGWDMIVCDYAGQENVTGADLHNDAMMIKSINNGLCLHCAF